MLVMVATSLIEYALDSRWTRGSQTDVLWTSSAPSNHTSPCYLAAATRSPFALWYCCTASHENDATIACVTYLHKYVSKSHGIVTCRRSAKWHAQARMLSRALPVDVVIMIWMCASLLLLCCKSSCAVLQFVALRGVCPAYVTRMEIWCTFVSYHPSGQHRSYIGLMTVNVRRCPNLWG